MFEENEVREQEKITDAQGHQMDFVRNLKSFQSNSSYFPINCSVCKEKIDTNLGYHKCDICILNYCDPCAIVSNKYSEIKQKISTEDQEKIEETKKETDEPETSEGEFMDY